MEYIKRGFLRNVGGIFAQPMEGRQVEESKSERYLDRLWTLDKKLEVSWYLDMRK